jgi:hypothetical protein
MPEIRTECLNCGETVVNRKASVIRKFCNKVCFAASQRMRPTVATCEGCKQQFEPTKSKKRYCSQSCATTTNNLKRIYKPRAKVSRDYREACVFRFSPELHPDKFDLTLVETIGWFNRKSNPNGLVKDHMYSVADGAVNDVPVTVINHPANCQLITYQENASKFSKSSITLEELYERIKNW